MLVVRSSGLARVMSCAGSLFFEDLPKQENIAAAEEGTAAGEYLRFLLENNLEKPKAIAASNGVAFDDDMAFYLRPIAEEILNRAQSKVLCEQAVDWPATQTITIKGSYDASFIGNDGKLYVDDLKYGWGVVEVKPNWQLLSYAVGEVMRRGIAFESVVLRIHQPRPHHEDGTTRTWELSYNELLSYMNRIMIKMKAIEDGEKTLATGMHCRYCRAASSCPAMNKSFFRGVEIVHEFMQDNLDENEISFQMDLISRIEEVVKIKKDSLRDLVVSRIKSGRVVPNYSIEPSHSDRRWRENFDIEAMEKLTGKKLTTSKVLSPAQVEKLGIPRTVVDAFTKRDFVKQNVVRQDSKSIGEKIFGK